MNSSSYLSQNLVPIVIFLIPIVAIIANVTLKIVKLQLLHETVRQLSANGQPIPQELLNTITNTKPS